LSNCPIWPKISNKNAQYLQQQKITLIWGILGCPLLLYSGMATLKWSNVKMFKNEQKFSNLVKQGKHGYNGKNCHKKM